MSSSYVVVDLINAARYDPPMRRVVFCDCGWELHLTPGASLPLPPGVEVLTFATPPHRFVVWQCVCGAELGVWTDRDGVPVAAAGDRPMANKVIHISGEAHAEIKRFCKSADLIMSEWASRVLTRAAINRVMPPRVIGREEVATREEAVADVYERPAFWEGRR